MKEKLKLIILMIIAILLIVGIVILGKNAKKSISEEVQHPVASFEIGDFGTIKMELYPEYAPNTVANFIALIQSGFYNNKTIYGKDDMALYLVRNDGDDAVEPTVSLIDSSVESGSDDDYEYSINGEFIANEFEQNILRHEKGTVSLNHFDYSSYGLTEEGYNSGNYRFSIMMQDTASLNGVYCAFGKVIEGLDIAENIYNNSGVVTSEEESESDGNTIKEFETKPVINNATVETYGVDYKKPEVHKAFDIQSYLNNLYSQYLN